jgi:CSLREA domain-containing protein
MVALPTQRCGSAFPLGCAISVDLTNLPDGCICTRKKTVASKTDFKYSHSSIGETTPMNRKRNTQSHPALFALITFLTLCLVTTTIFIAPVQAGTTITVTTTNDELNTDGDCSLREAIEAANTDSTVSGCPAGNGTDTIVLPSGTYKLTTGLTVSGPE